jgi:hypothetical protein
MAIPYFLIVLVTVAAIIIAAILISRANYQRKIVELKLTAHRERLEVNETYWYNSSRGLLVSNEPSCWAKVLSEPRVFGQNKMIVVDVLLNVSTKRIETTVPAESLAKIEQLNS